MARVGSSPDLTTVPTTEPLVNGLARSSTHALIAVRAKTNDFLPPPPPPPPAAIAPAESGLLSCCKSATRLIVVLKKENPARLLS